MRIWRSMNIQQQADTLETPNQLKKKKRKENPHIIQDFFKNIELI